MALFDPVNTSTGVFAQVLHKHCPRAKVYWERSLQDYTTKVAITWGVVPGSYPLQLFHPDGTVEEYDQLPMQFSLHGHNRSEIFTKLSQRWWNSGLQPLRECDVNTHYRTLQLIT